MSKRIKQVFSSNAQLCHVWASETQETGRANNVFFNSSEIYSYGYHFLAAKIYTNERGEKFALMNECRYSVSTAKHLRDIRSALIGRMKYVEVPNPSNINDKQNEEYFLDKISEELGNIFNSRVQYASRHYLSLIVEYNLFLSFRDGKNVKLFDLDSETKETIEFLIREKVAKSKTREIERQVKLEKERQARLLEYADELKLWPLNKNTKNIPYDLFSSEYDLIRIASNGTDVETSRGAIVPLSHATRLLNLVLTGQARVGDRVGHFTLDEINEETLTIGCHTINIEQAKTVLKTSPVLTLVQNAI